MNSSNSRNSRNNNSDLTRSLGRLTGDEESIVKATLMGDASLVRRGNSFRVKIDHGIDQKSYVNWKREKLARLCPTTQPPKEVTDKRGFVGVEFYTSSSSIYAPIHDLLFVKQPNGRYKKTLTPEFC